MLLTSVFAVQAEAGGWSNSAVPTKITTTNEGIFIQGAFGNPMSCGSDIGVFVNDNTRQYEFVKAAALTALMGQKKMQFWIYTCYTGYEGWNLGLVYPDRHISIGN